VTSASVYVGNLSWDVDWKALKDHFKQAGHVVHADVMVEPSGRSKGCGLVSFGSARDASNAITSLHDSHLNGRPIFVREDREAGKGAPAAAPTVQYAQRMPGRAPPARNVAPAVTAGAVGAGCKVHVGNLAWETSWQDLKDLMKGAGAVLRADIAQGPDGRSKGHGTVSFGSTKEAAKAIQLFHESDFKGRLLNVTPDAFA